MLILFAFFLLLSSTSFSGANVIYSSSTQISTPSKDLPIEKEMKREYGNKDCTIEMDRMSARLLRLEQGISLLNSKNENINEKDLILQLNSRLEDLENKVDLYVSKKIEVGISYLVEFETRIMERVSNRLLSLDSKFVEQTKQISEIFSLLGKKHADNEVTSTTPSPTSPTSTASSLSTLETTTATSETKSAPENKNNCTYSTKRNEVKCKNVPIKDIMEFFKRTDIITDQQLLRSIDLTILQGDEMIPAHLLNNKKTEKLVIEYHKDPSVPLLKVDLNAFQSTKNCTKTLKLSKLDGSQLDLGFLSGFNQLTDLEFYKIDQFQKSFLTLPLLPKLTGLRLEIVRGFDDSMTFPTLSSAGLKTFEFLYYDGKQNDALVSRMLDWILPPSSKTLESLTLVDIKLTKIPSQIPSFTALTRLHCSE